MTLIANVTSFNVTTSAIGTTQNVAHGLGVAPKVIILWGSGRTEAVDTTGTASHRRGMGFAVSTTSRRCVGMGANDGAATATTARRATDAAVYCAVTPAATPTAAGLLDINAIDATNVQFIIDEVFVINSRVFMLCLAGDDITNAEIQNFTTAGVAGDENVTSFSFQPDFVMFLAYGATNPTLAPSTHGFMSVGAARSSTEEAVWAGLSEHGPTNMDTYRFLRADKCLVHANNLTTGSIYRAQFVQFLSNGFRINWLEAPTTQVAYVLAIKGGGHNVKTLTMSATVGTQLPSGTLDTAQVRGALHTTHGAAETADAAAMVAHDVWSTGAWSSLTARGTHSLTDVDAAGTSDVYTKVEYDNVMAKLDTVGADVGMTDIDVIGTNNFELDQTTAASGTIFTWFWSFGDNVVAPTDDGISGRTRMTMLGVGL